VPLRYRTNGCTPQKQIDFVEALADCGVIRQEQGRTHLTRIAAPFRAPWISALSTSANIRTIHDVAARRKG
jgi:hypothetical protein